MSAGVDPATGMPPGTEALYRAALGPSGARVYLPFFARFEERGRSGPVWSPRAALGNLGWLVYWRLWNAVLVQSSLTVIGTGALGWLWTRADGVPMGVKVGLTAVVCALWWALPALWGVAWLHAGLRQRMTAAVEEADTFKEAVERLERSANAWRMPGLVAAAAGALSVALLAGVVWQLWRDPVVAGEQASARPPQTPPPIPAPAPKPVPVPAQAEAAPALAQPEPVIAIPVVAPTAALPPPASATSGIRPRVRGFGVNVGLFAVVANAERAKARLSEAGLPVLDDPIESARGPLIRVRVGPFERREQAEAAAQKVRALGLEARVYAP